MSDTAFTVKVDERVFTLDRITLGDWRMFKTSFGLNASDIVATVINNKGDSVEALNLDDPNVLIALMVAALKHERPTAPIASLIAEVEALGMEGLDFSTDDEEDETPDPQSAADGNAATAGRSKSGSSAKRQKNSGRQSGPKS